MPTQLRRPCKRFKKLHKPFCSNAQLFGASRAVAVTKSTTKTDAAVKVVNAVGANFLDFATKARC